MAPPPRPVLLLTRPAAAAQRFRQSLGAAADRLDVITSPLIELCFRDAPLPAGIAALIFTSESGVRAFARLAAPGGRVAWCVGDRTAGAARAAGFVARSAGGDAGDLLDLLIRERVPGPLLHVRGVHARGSLAERLNSAGIETKEAVLYDQEARDLSAAARGALNGPAAVVAPLFSPRTARLFAHAVAGAAAPLHLIALSPAVAAELATLSPASLAIAARPEAAAMRAVVAERIAAAQRA